MEAERPSPAASKHVAPLLKHFSPSASHHFPYRAPNPPHTHLTPARQSPPAHKSTYIPLPWFAFPQTAVKSYGAWQRNDMRRLSGEAAQTPTVRFFLFHFFSFFLKTTSGCPLLRKQHLMDRQAAINTSHFSSRPYSHFHFDVITISSLPIVTGLQASIYTHWLQGKKEI